MRDDLEPDWTRFVRQASERIDATFERISEMFEREEDALNSKEPVSVSYSPSADALIRLP
jgi:hypothetical protein